MEETITEEPKRPQFLTVLCILTFIGVGIGIIGSVGGWWWMNKMSAMMNSNSDMMENMPGMDDPANMEKMMNTIKYGNVLLISGILSSLICLWGALQMWKQKKMGFFIYIIGEVAPLIVSGVCMGAVAFSGWGMLSLILPILFIILYGLNLKHLS